MFLTNSPFHNSQFNKLDQIDSKIAKAAIEFIVDHFLKPGTLVFVSIEVK